MDQDEDDDEFDGEIEIEFENFNDEFAAELKKCEDGNCDDDKSRNSSKFSRENKLEIKDNLPIKVKTGYVKISLNGGNDRRSSTKSQISNHDDNVVDESNTENHQRNRRKSNRSHISNRPTVPSNENDFNNYEYNNEDNDKRNKPKTQISNFDDQPNNDEINDIRSQHKRRKTKTFHMSNRDDLSNINEFKQYEYNDPYETKGGSRHQKHFTSHYDDKDNLISKRSRHYRSRRNNKRRSHSRDTYDPKIHGDYDNDEDPYSNKSKKERNINYDDRRSHHYRRSHKYIDEPRSSDFRESRYNENRINEDKDKRRYIKVNNSDEEARINRAHKKIDYYFGEEIKNDKRDSGRNQKYEIDENEPRSSDIRDSRRSFQHGEFNENEPRSSDIRDSRRSHNIENLYGRKPRNKRDISQIEHYNETEHNRRSHKRPKYDDSHSKRHKRHNPIPNENDKDENDIGDEEGLNEHRSNERRRRRSSKSRKRKSKHDEDNKPNELIEETKKGCPNLDLLKKESDIRENMINRLNLKKYNNL